MSKTFSKGEIVVFVPDFKGEFSLHKYAGEVEILGFDDFFHMYSVQAPGFWFWADPCVLRKRPQPPDWNALSTPTDTPREVECA